MGLIRLILYFLFFYFLFKLVRRLLGLGTPKSRASVQGKQQPPKPPPYDPKNVEDIDYREL